MTSGQSAALGVAVFIGTGGLVVWSSTTLPAPAIFALGMGWMLVLLALSQRERSLEQGAGQRGVVLVAPRPFTRDERMQASEDYRLNHDVRDLATLPCRYGCKEPVTCPFPHRECPHCLEARDQVRLMARADGR